MGARRNSLDDLRSDDLAGTAPGGEEVNDHEALLAESGVEFGLAVNHVESVFCLFRAQGWRKCGRARVCANKTYVARLWTPVEVDMVAEKLRLVVAVMLWLNRVEERKVAVVVVVADLNADVGGVRLRWSAELARVRERIREADILEGVWGRDYIQVQLCNGTINKMMMVGWRML